MTTKVPMRVVVADDSRLMRRILKDGLTAQGFEVVAEAKDGDEALAICERVRPDAMTLDLAMPGTDGIEVLRRLPSGAGEPVPVIVVSAFSPAHGARAVDALAEGAFDLEAKPAAGEPLDGFLASIAHKLRAAAGTRRSPLTPAPRRAASAPAGPGAIRRTAGALRRTERAVIIASSTGGPRALASVVPRLPAELGRGVVIVQHMPAGFTESLAARLDRSSAMSVREAAERDAFASGQALVAPGNHHLRIDARGVMRLETSEPIGGLRPRADLTIEDAAAVFGRKLLLVVLTGMGNDGLKGAQAVKAAGGRIIAEAAETCTVYGMPRAVAEAGLADIVVPLQQIPDAIVAEASR